MSAIFGELLTFRQKRGFPVQLRTYGDEFYCRYETRAGYSVLYDHDLGLYCYARLDKGKFVSTAVPMKEPPPVGLPKHLEESSRVRTRRKWSRYRRLLLDPAGPGARHAEVGPGGLLAGPRLSRGRIRGLTILVDFPWLHAGVDADDVFLLLNGHRPDQAEPDPVPTDPPDRWSAFQYFGKVSCGRLLYENDVVGPIRMDHKRGYYIDELLVEEALTKACEQYDLDLTEYDSLGRGRVDALSFLYAGRTVYAGNLWPHNSVAAFDIGGVKTHFYAIASMGRTAEQLTIGTFCHESGHMLCRFPDLYDYGTEDGDLVDSWGLGYFCLMSYGNHLDAGRTPAPPSAYLRDLVGWTRREDLRVAGTKVARRGDFERVFHHPTDAPNEYFLIENRGGQCGLDLDLPAAGLALFHCDTQGSNEWQAGSPTRHYQCALVQADGKMHLERYQNGGDDEDLFKDVPGMATSVSTAPNTRTWQGMDSGLDLSAVSAAGPEMRFVVGAGGKRRRVRGRVFPDAAIPDADPAGLKSEIALRAAGLVSAVSVAVDISHPRRGELHLRLLPPAGPPITLYRGRGGWGAGVRRRFTPASCTALSRAEGRPVKGRWTLWIADGQPGARGRIKAWALEVDCRP